MSKCSKTQKMLLPCPFKNNLKAQKICVEVSTSCHLIVQHYQNELTKKNYKHTLRHLLQTEQKKITKEHKTIIGILFDKT